MPSTQATAAATAKGTIVSHLTAVSGHCMRCCSKRAKDTSARKLPSSATERLFECSGSQLLERQLLRAGVNNSCSQHAAAPAPRPWRALLQRRLQRPSRAARRTEKHLQRLLLRRCFAAVSGRSRAAAQSRVAPESLRSSDWRSPMQGWRSAQHRLRASHNHPEVLQRSQ